MAVTDLAAVAMREFRERLANHGYVENSAGSMHGHGQVIKLTYTMGEVTLVVRQGNDHATNRVERVPHHDLGRLDLLAAAIIGDLSWPVWG